MQINVIDVTLKKEFEFSVNHDEHITYVLVGTSGQSGECRFSVHLAGPQAQATIIGVILVSGDQNFSLLTQQLHEAPDTTSNLLVKCVISGSAQFAYDGAIRVEKQAQKTDAYQRNENLLLDQQAYATSKPALEILANDVRCTHGAIVKTLDPWELWYLSSRGIGEEKGRELIKRGFISHAISRIPDTITQEKVRKMIGLSEG